MGLLVAAVSVYTQEVPQQDAGPSRLEELRAEENALFSDDEQAQEGGEVDTFGLRDLLRMVLVLGLVVVAIYGVFHILRRSSRVSGSDDDLISVLGSRALPGNRSLHLVEVGRQVFLVGASERSVELVAEIGDQESLDEIRLQAANRPSMQRRTFSDMLSGVLGGGTSLGDSLSFMSKQKERLKKL